VITWKIVPLEFKTASGEKAVITGVAPQKHQCVLVGEVETSNGSVDMQWWSSGEAVDKDSRKFNLEDDGDVFLAEFNQLAAGLCSD